MFILDDVIGVFGVEYDKITNLERCRESILNALGERSKILFTCRKAVYKEAANRKSFVLNKEYLIDLEDSNNQLNAEDRKQILNNYCKPNDISLRQDEQPNVLSSVGIMMYPLLCKLFCSEPKYRESGKEFFEKPSSCILKQLDSLKNFEKLKYASLVMCMLYKNKITESMLHKKHPEFMEIREKVFDNCRVSDSTNTQILDSLDHMLGTFTAYTNDRYSLIHDSVYEVLAFQYGKENQEDMLQYMSSSFVAKKFTVNDISDEPVELLIKIHEKNYKVFAARLVRDLEESKLHDVFTNEALKTPCVCNALIDELKKWEYFETKNFFFRKRENTPYICGRSDEEGFKQESTEWSVAEMEREELLVPEDWQGKPTIRVISWVIGYGHSQLLQFLFDLVITNEKSVGSVLDWEKQERSGNNYISNQRERIRLLDLSCYSGSLEVVRLLLQHFDVDCINGPSYPYVTPLIAALDAGHVDIVDLLIKFGADCNKSDKYGRTPLCEASEYSNADIVDLLIKGGAAFEKQITDMYTTNT